MRFRIGPADQVDAVRHGGEHPLHHDQHQVRLAHNYQPPIPEPTIVDYPLTHALVGAVLPDDAYEALLAALPAEVFFY